MTKVRNTQSAAEVVIQATATARSTQNAAEVILESTPNVRSTQNAAEVILESSPNVRTTQNAAEVILESTPRVRSTQNALEVLFQIVTAAIGTSAITEAPDVSTSTGVTDTTNKTLITEQPDTVLGIGLTVSTLVQPGKETQIDVKLVQNSPFDFEIADDGDFELVDGFDTSIQMSIFCERRASSSEVPEAIRRRGWIGNALTDFPGFEIGSKIWLYEQAKMTNDTFNGIRDAAVDSLEWLVEDGFAVDLASSIVGFTQTGKVELQVTIFASSSLVEQRFFTLWQETGR